MADDEEDGASVATTTTAGRDEGGLPDFDEAPSGGTVLPSVLPL